MSLKFYILKDGQPVECEDAVQWAVWFESVGEGRVVARTELGGETAVSTVFLGIDHRFFGQGPPLLFETMVFGGPWDGEQRRWSTREQAVEGHFRMVERARQPRPPREEDAG